MVEVANNRTLIFRVRLYRTGLTYNVQFYHTVSYGRYGMAYVAVQYSRMVRPYGMAKFLHFFSETKKSSKCHNLARKVKKKYCQNFALTVAKQFSHTVQLNCSATAFVVFSEKNMELTQLFNVIGSNLKLLILGQLLLLLLRTLCGSTVEYSRTLKMRVRSVAVLFPFLMCKILSFFRCLRKKKLMKYMQYGCQLRLESFFESKNQHDLFPFLMCKILCFFLCLWEKN